QAGELHLLVRDQKRGARARGYWLHAPRLLGSHHLQDDRRARLAQGDHAGCRPRPDRSLTSPESWDSGRKNGCPTGATRPRCCSAAPRRPPPRDQPDGKLVVVSSITPTPAGDGKTTMTIGIGQALARIGARPVIALREPSIGPTLGMKGGGTGGGLAQVVP